MFWVGVVSHLLVCCVSSDACLLVHSLPTLFWVYRRCTSLFSQVTTYCWSPIGGAGPLVNQNCVSDLPCQNPNRSCEGLLYLQIQDPFWPILSGLRLPFLWLIMGCQESTTICPITLVHINYSLYLWCVFFAYLCCCPVRFSSIQCIESCSLIICIYW